MEGVASYGMRIAEREEYFSFSTLPRLMKPPLSLLLVALCACGESSSSSPAEPTPFQFSTSRVVDVDLRVQLDGVALPFCSVQLLAGTGPLGSVVFLGATDSSGDVKVAVNIPAALQEVTVVVQHPGATGPNSDPEEAKAQGFFAPSSKQIISVDELNALLVPLTAEGA